MSLFVGNISRQVSQRELQRLFSDFGPCKLDLKSSFAFVDYDDERDAEVAIKELYGKKVSGLFINVEWSRKSNRFDPNKRALHKRREDWYPSHGDRRGSPPSRRRSPVRYSPSYRRDYDRRSRSRSRSSPRRSSHPSDNGQSSGNNHSYRIRSRSRSSDVSPRGRNPTAARQDVNMHFSSRDVARRAASPRNASDRRGSSRSASPPRSKRHDEGTSRYPRK